MAIHTGFAGVDGEVWIITSSRNCGPILTGMPGRRGVERAGREGRHDISIGRRKRTWTIHGAWPTGRSSGISTTDLYQIIQIGNTSIEQTMRVWSVMCVLAKCVRRVLKLMIQWNQRLDHRWVTATRAELRHRRRRGGKPLCEYSFVIKIVWVVATAAI